MPGIDSSTGVVRKVGAHFYDTMLRNKYLPKVTETLNDPNITWGRMQTLDSTEFEGQFLEWRNHVGRNNGINAVGQDGYLPDPGKQTYDKYRVPLRSVRGRVLIDPLLGETTTKNVAAWANSTTEEMSRMTGDAIRSMNRMIHGDGSGRIGQLHASTPLSNGSGTNDRATLTPITGTEGSGYMPSAELNRFFVPGRRYAVLDSSASYAVLGVVYCSAVVGVTQVDFTSDEALTLPVNLGTNAVLSAAAGAGDVFVEVSRTGTTSHEDTGYKREIMGLGGFSSDADLAHSYYELSDGTDTTHFQGTPSANGEWNQGIVLDNGSAGRPLTHELLNDAFMTYHKKNLKYPSAMLTNYEVAKAWYALIADQRQFHQATAASPSYDGAIRELTWDGVRVMKDRDADAHRITFWRDESLGRTMARDWGWMDMDGSMLDRVADKEKYQATLIWDGNIWTELRREAMVLTNLIQG